MILFDANAPELRDFGLRPKNVGEVRAWDKYHEVYVGQSRPREVPVTQHVSVSPCTIQRSQLSSLVALLQTNKCWPATRARDGTHVMIQLIRKRGEGELELEILRRFSRPDVATHPDNHVIPLLDELIYLDMVSAIFPLLRESVISPWYFDVGEALDAVYQTFKASPSAHEDNTGFTLNRNENAGPGIYASKSGCSPGYWASRHSVELRRHCRTSRVYESLYDVPAVQVNAVRSLSLYLHRL